MTSKGVYLHGHTDTIQFLDTATGKIHDIATLDKTARDLCVSPDDAYAVWEQTDRNSMDLMLVEGFR